MNTNNRIWEVDFIRGLAIILMVIFHLIVDLKDFYSYDIEYLGGFWYYEGKLSAILFMLTSGISSTFSKNNTKRGAVVFGFGLILSLATYLFDPEYYIRFGILHFLGVCMLLYKSINKLSNKVTFSLATSFIIIGNAISKITIDTPYFFPLGLTDRNFSSLDYYPIFPWLGVFLYGVIIGKTIYKQKRSLFVKNLKLDTIVYLGQHSLLIYLTHQPMLLALLYLGHKL
ncbi:heparan-alpha-glucosaminide N-acetyltransferase [Petroclostridium sp. X23]|uniref:heparan-alpha-glucosaminide N-acetyltransferase n=1 Tax=Petroclostridium sp. X23 TaxID=3045146 RepID=UPI0024ADC431|nr:heparan-alpha-glucosaminide N-acetyltransferase [Petroclostridium sp. X23]WHH59954.1 heparan-alpha-glucosaminide N-acetyltransferase [Petroclostridium sp. X23]